MVTVLVFGLTLRDAVGETEFEIEVSAPTTVRKSLNRTRIAWVHCCSSC